MRLSPLLSNWEDIPPAQRDVTRTHRMYPPRPTRAIKAASSGVSSRHQVKEPSAAEQFVKMVAQLAPLSGEALSAADAGKQLRKGNLGAATLAGVGAIPLIGKLNKAGKAKRGIEAWHGSPHSFDKFDISRIGTGEGAQAYGHGLYFAGSKGTADTYKHALSDRVVRIGDEVYKPSRTVADRTDPRAIAHDYLTVGYDAQSQDPFGYARKAIRSNVTSGQAEDAIKVLNDWQRRGAKVEGGGHLYRVNLDVDEDELLDWDTALADQPHLLRKINRGIPVGGGRLLPSISGASAYRGLGYREAERVATPFQRTSGNYHADDAAASQALRELGIPGIKYWDQMSREGQKGTRNYVMFDDKRISILDRLALAGLLGGGAVAADRRSQ